MGRLGRGTIRLPRAYPGLCLCRCRSLIAIQTGYQFAYNLPCTLPIHSPEVASLEAIAIRFL